MILLQPIITVTFLSPKKERKKERKKEIKKERKKERKKGKNLGKYEYSKPSKEEGGQTERKRG